MKLQQDLRPNAEDTYTKSLEFLLFCTHKKQISCENHNPTPTKEEGLQRISQQQEKLVRKTQKPRGPIKLEVQL
jgi:hypothetical protein